MMANQLGISQPQTSKHLRILHDAGLVTVTIDANRRRYALKSQALEPLDAWQTYIARETERLNRLESFLAESQREENNHEYGQITCRGHDMIMERLFKAPRQLVFEAFSTPAHLEKWWGPAGWETKVYNFDFKQMGVGITA